MKARHATWTRCVLTRRPWLGRPVADVTVHRWDVSFHEERVRRSRLPVDQEALRAYFQVRKASPSPSPWPNCSTALLSLHVT